MNFIELRPGTSVEGDKIEAFKTETKAKKYIYLMAGTHGDEVEGVYVVKQLFEWLKEQDDIELNMVVIPILNPDGLRIGSRVNANGVDLNRNHDSGTWSPTATKSKYNPGTAPLSEPENQYLVSLLKKFPPSIILSFHSWKPMLNYNGDCAKVANFLNTFNGYEVCDDIKDHPTPGSLGDLAPKKFNSPVLTFECPVLSDDQGLKEIWAENEEGLKALFNSELL
ncbi:hypothetical protein A9Q84_17195 [Halobacteriovorax marinus]|uniref:Peptidase M14 domain-containing protein n=1 Tax=Halobacteriovorax marinus TaxID=97084 RepID=A0A1Y5F3N7_9BACT|nr:hypothetical protein A9Q84_17195 [Halobacteriovorax marinus]